MKFLEDLIVITMFSTAVILILLYSGVLWHTFRGSKFRFVYMIATLLILSNVLLIVHAFKIIEYKKSSTYT